MGIEDNKRIAASFFANISKGAIDAALALMADDATFWVLGKPDRFPAAGTMSKPQFADLMAKIEAAVPGGMRMEIRGCTAEGDRVALEMESFATTRGGKQYNNCYHYLLEVRDGKIRAVREYTDTMHAMEVLLAP